MLTLLLLGVVYDVVVVLYHFLLVLNLFGVPLGQGTRYSLLAEEVALQLSV